MGGRSRLTGISAAGTEEAGSALFRSPEMRIASALAIAAVLLQMLTNGRYGYFRDELYFIATTHHLDWGYVDFAPLSSFRATL